MLGISFNASGSDGGNEGNQGGGSDEGGVLPGGGDPNNPKIAEEIARLAAEDANGGLGELVSVKAKDPAAELLAERIGGQASVRFANGPANEFDADQLFGIEVKGRTASRTGG